MTTQVLEKLNNRRFETVERAIEELREEWKEQSHYMAAFLATRGEKRVSLEKLVKKHHLKQPR